MYMHLPILRDSMDLGGITGAAPTPGLGILGGYNGDHGLGVAAE